MKEVIALRDDVFITLQDLGMNRAEAYRFMELAVKGSFRRRAALCADAGEALQKIDVPAWYLDSLLKLRYLFPKAHAAVYTLQSYQLGRYKAHYPAACRAAVQACSGAKRRS